MKIDYLELDVTDEAYEMLGNWGPFLLTGLDGEAVGLLDAIPNLDTIDYAVGYTNQTEEWIQKYKHNRNHVRLVNARKIKQSEFDTYRHLKALPAMAYAFHLEKPEVALTTFGLIECSTS